MKEHGYHLPSISTINHVMNWKGKKREKRWNGEEWMYQRQSPVLTPPVLKCIKRKLLVENPPTLKTVSQQLKIPISTIGSAIRNKLKMDTRRKTKVHVLEEKDVKNRKTNARKLYERILSGKKSMFVVTLDEAYIHVRQKGNDRGFYYIEVGKERERNVLTQSNENFPDRFMVVGAMCEKRTFPLIKVPMKTKVTATYYQDYVLRPLIEQHLVPFFGEDINKVTIHHDKASSHVAHTTTHFLEEMIQKYGIRFLLKEDIPVKGPDISPMDFFGFGFIKQTVGRSRARTEMGVWKKCVEAWDNVKAEVCMNVFKSWKKRCRTVIKEGGQHCEHIHGIHSHKIRL